MHQRTGSTYTASMQTDWHVPDLWWRVTTSWVRRPLWVNLPGQLSLLPPVGQRMSSISIARWVKLLAAVPPSSECLYEGKAEVVYMQVTVIHIWALSGRDTDDRRYISSTSFPFLSSAILENGAWPQLPSFPSDQCWWPTLLRGIEQ